MKSPKLTSKTNHKRSLVCSEVSGSGDSRSDSKRAKFDSQDRTFCLSSGQRLPVVQYGTYKMKGEECYQGVLAALRAGYRGLDTAYNDYGALHPPLYPPTIPEYYDYGAQVLNC